MLQFSSLNSVMEPRGHFKNGASSKSLMSRGNIMQKFFLFFFFFCICIASAFAQDVITLKNGDEIQALVQEVGDVEVKYKKLENPTGPNYTLKKSEVFMIKYENGSRDVFVNDATNTQTTDTPATTTTTLSPTTNRQSLQSQTSTPLEPLSVRGSRVYDSKGKELSRYELESVLNNVPEALRTYRSGRSLVTTGTVISYTGGFIIGFHLGRVLIDDERKINGLVLGVGGGLSVVGIIMGSAGGSKSKAAVDIYNASARRQQTSDLSLNFGITQSGWIGSTLNF